MVSKLPLPVKALLVLSVIWMMTGCGLAVAQDYFLDRHANGNPIIFSAEGSNNLLFSAGIDLSDNSSVKANLYRQYWISKSTYKPLDIPRHKDFIGWGASLKGNMTNGLGNLFSYGAFDPAFNGGVYLAFTRLNWTKTTTGSGTYFSNWAVILSQNISYATYQFYDATQPYASQLSEKNFTGRVTTLSYVLQLHPKSDNLMVGASFAYSRKSNYTDLNTVTIKNDSVTSGSGKVRTITDINTYGDTYALGRYREYNNYNLRLNCSYIPEALNNKIGFTFYPSVDLSAIYAPKYNLGLSFSYLKDKSPSTPIASLFFEVDDMNNAAHLAGSFLSRSFNIGISSTLNMLTGNK